MSSHFPAPWRIVEISNGFVVNDAAGQQLAVFYGRASPNAAGHPGCLTIDEARALAVDFARLPELLNRYSESPESTQRDVARRARAFEPGRSWSRLS